MASAPEVPSARFGAYRIRRRLGEGGMAVVYLAETSSQRGPALEVALKFMKQLDGSEVDAADLFSTEADLLGLLRHPNLVGLHEVGSFQGRLFQALELCAGGDLERLLARLRQQGRPMPASVALHVGIDVLRALSYLHQAESMSGNALGLVHGDVNPGNVFLARGPGRAKLGDLGVVSATSLGGGLPEGVAAGKAHYLSPEQAQGKPLTPASDLFSVGVIMHELLLGHRPFEGEDVEEVREKVAACRLVRPDEVSKQLWEILEQALAKNPRSRFPTAGAFGGALLRYQLDAGLDRSADPLGELLDELDAPAA